MKQYILTLKTIDTEIFIQSHITVKINDTFWQFIIRGPEYHSWTGKIQQTL